jgi:IMP dehydrogenase
MKFKKSLTYDDIQIIPRYSKIKSRLNCDLTTNFTKNFKIEKPYVSSPMDTVTEGDMSIRMMELGGVGCVHRFISIENQIDILNRIVKRKEELGLIDYPVCISVGVKTSVDEMTKLVESGANVILIDVAHGNTSLVKKTIALIKNNFPKIDIIAGNIATSEGAKNLCKWGVSAIRVGIGNGSLCETRIRTGIGIPQVTALLDTVKVAKKFGVPVIADGGIRYIGDVTKALALGASSVMFGSILSGTKESPGSIEKMGQWPNEQLFKKYRGSASLDTKKSHNLEEKNVEGNSKIIPYKGKVKRLIDDINDGVKSGMSYVNAKNLYELNKKSKFIKITQSGIIEAKPHLL